MLMVYAPRAITYPDSYILNEPLPCKTTHANSLNNISICLGPIRAPCSSLLSASSFYWKSRNQLSGPKKWLVSVHTCSLVFHIKEKIFFLDIYECVISFAVTYYSARCMIQFHQMTSIVHRGI